MNNNKNHDIYSIVLRAKDGRERKVLAWIPNQAVREDFYTKARKRGLEVVEK